MGAGLLQSCPERTTPGCNSDLAPGQGLTKVSTLDCSDTPDKVLSKQNQILETLGQSSTFKGPQSVWTCVFPSHPAAHSRLPDATMAG